MNKRCSGCSVLLVPDNTYGNGSGRRRGKCRACENARNAEYRKANREKVRATQATWRNSLRGRELSRSSHLLRNYGITQEDYETILSAQGNACALNTEHTTPGGGKARFFVDHDHETGRVRGLLCFNCNTAIGKLGDNEEGLRRAYEYVTGRSIHAGDILWQA